MHQIPHIFAVYETLKTTRLKDNSRIKVRRATMSTDKTLWNSVEGKASHGREEKGFIGKEAFESFQLNFIE